MKKIIYLLAFILFTGAVFVSCEKDESSEPKENKLIPIKISEYEDNVLVGETINEYNDKNKVIKTDHGDGNYETYEYDSEDKLIKTIVYEENVLLADNTFEYNSSNQLIKINCHNSKGELQSYYTHEYDNSGNVIKKSQYGSNDALVLYFTFAYDSNGNMINQKYYWADSEEVSTDKYEEWIYTYDDKNDIYKSVEMPFVFESHVNNPVQITFTEHYGDNYTETHTNVYTYNEENYPIEYTESVDNEKYVIEYKQI